MQYEVNSDAIGKSTPELLGHITTDGAIVQHCGEDESLVKQVIGLK
jgi:hypothetical protein